jgi:biotin operon repressor
MNSGRSTMTQKQLILKHLQENKGITLLEALTKYGVLNISARIQELRSMGYYIETLYRKDEDINKTVAEYRLGSVDAK